MGDRQPIEQEFRDRPSSDRLRHLFDLVSHDFQDDFALTAISHWPKEGVIIVEFRPEAGTMIDTMIYLENQLLFYSATCYYL
jgi:hypothetical protein